MAATGTKTLTPIEAYSLLIKDMDTVRYKRVIDHSVNVGLLAGEISARCGLDRDYATVLGFIHDIGRKIDSKNHVYFGYRYLEELGYSDYSYICLTHSFLNNELDCVAGLPLGKDAPGYDFMLGYVRDRKYTLYDKIIQVCDLLCKDSGFTTLEDRLLDIETRRGKTDKAGYHKKTAEKQMEDIERIMGCAIYSLYDRIKKPDYLLNIY